MLSTPISHNVLKKTSAVNEEELHIADNIQDVPHDWFPWHLNRNVEFHDMKFNLSKKTTLKNWAIFSSFRFSLFWKVKNLYSLRLPTHPDLPNPLLLFCFFPHNNALLQQEVSPHSSPFCWCLLPHEITWEGSCVKPAPETERWNHTAPAAQSLLSNNPAKCEEGRMNRYRDM